MLLFQDCAVACRIKVAVPSAIRIGSVDSDRHSPVAGNVRETFGPREFRVPRTNLAPQFSGVINPNHTLSLIECALGPSADLSLVFCRCQIEKMLTLLHKRPGEQQHLTLCVTFELDPGLMLQESSQHALRDM